MANEINLGFTPSVTLYTIAISATGQYANGTTPEAFTSGHWTNYAVALPEISAGSGRYQASFPALPAGVYRVEVYQQVGGSPALTDGPPIAEGEMQWSGTAQVPLTAVSLNLGQTGLTPRALDSVADNALTVGDALVAAIAAAAGKESITGTSYVIKTPSTGTVIRTFVLDSSTSPTSRS